MIETILKNFLAHEKEMLESSISHGKELLKTGEFSQDEYQRYLRMTFQQELESLLGTKFDTEGGKE